MTLKLLFNLFMAAVGVHFVYNLIRMVPEIIRMLELKKLERSLDVITVEAEIIEVDQKPAGVMDTEYDIKLCYFVGWDKYYKNIKMLNKQAVRVGQKVMLLCSSDDPSQSTFAEGEMITESGNEMMSLKHRIYNIAFDFFMFVVALILILGSFI